MLLCAAFLAACSTGEKGSQGAATTTTEPPSAVTALPPLPSTIAPARSSCGPMSDLYGLDDLVLQKGQWALERQRVVTDARREASLLRQAMATVPELRERLATMAAYADAVADAVSSAPSYDAGVTAVRAIDGAAAMVAQREVTAWERQNSC